MKKLILLFSASILIVCCDSKIGGGMFSKSFINNFKTIQSSQISATTAGVNVRGVNMVSSSLKDSLLVKYNDVNFNRTIDYAAERSVFSESFLAIDMVSDNAFDDNHPSFSSIADISTFLGSTPYPYIKSGYDDAKECRSVIVNKKLNTLTVNDLYLLNDYFSISFDSQPVIKGLHKMKLILTKEDGTKAELPFEIDFK